MSAALWFTPTWPHEHASVNLVFTSMLRAQRDILWRVEEKRSSDCNSWQWNASVVLYVWLRFHGLSFHWEALTEGTPTPFANTIFVKLPNFLPLLCTLINGQTLLCWELISPPTMLGKLLAIFHVQRRVLCRIIVVNSIGIAWNLIFVRYSNFKKEVTFDYPQIWLFPDRLNLYQLLKTKSDLNAWIVWISFFRFWTTLTSYSIVRRLRWLQKKIPLHSFHLVFLVTAVQ